MNDRRKQDKKLRWRKIKQENIRVSKDRKSSSRREKRKKTREKEVTMNRRDGWRKGMSGKRKGYTKLSIASLLQAEHREGKELHPDTCLEKPYILIKLSKPSVCPNCFHLCLYISQEKL